MTQYYGQCISVGVIHWTGSTFSDHGSAESQVNAHKQESHGADFSVRVVTVEEEDE